MKVFAVSADNLLNDSENSVVELQNHELNEQLMLINQLDEDEKNALIKIINSMLTKKRMKDLLDGKVGFWINYILAMEMTSFRISLNLTFR